MALQSCVAASAPNASFSSVITAPAKRATPEIKCCVDNSRTAVVRLTPGIRTIKLASTTDFTSIGTNHALTTVATNVASNAEIASKLALSRGRPSEIIANAPVTRPIPPAAARSTHDACRIAATAADAMP